MPGPRHEHWADPQGPLSPIWPGAGAATAPCPPPPPCHFVGSLGRGEVAVRRTEVRPALFRGVWGYGARLGHLQTGPQRRHEEPPSCAASLAPREGAGLLEVRAQPWASHFISRGLSS